MLVKENDVLPLLGKKGYVQELIANAPHSDHLRSGTNKRDFKNEEDDTI